MRTVYYFARIFLPASILLAGCTSDPSAPAQTSSNVRIQAPLAQTSNIVFVLPIDGMSNPGRLVLADAIAASLRDAARPSVISGQANDQGPTIAGRISEVRKRGSIAWVTAIWELRAPYGTAVANVSHEIVVDSLLWDEGGVEAVNLIIAEAEPHIIGMVADHVGPLTVTDEIAMPPEERFAAPTGTSQVVQNFEPAPIALPAVRVAPAPVNAPVARPTAPAPLEQDLPVVSSLPEELMEEENELEELELEQDSGDENGLTQSDREAKPPLAARQKPMRLMPRDGDLLELREEDEDERGEAMDEAALAQSDTRQSARVRPAILSDGEPDQAKPIAWGRPSFSIRPVSGAPGDGNEVLTIEIKRAMRAQDLTISDDPRQAAYEVIGRVTVGPPVNGRQQARVIWLVNTLDGVEVGKAMQENAVIAGSLNGEWGRVGEIVAQAAANGIQELFANRPNLSQNSQQSPDFSRNPNLQQVPGRGPPPPGS